MLTLTSGSFLLLATLFPGLGSILGALNPKNAIVNLVTPIIIGFLTKVLYQAFKKSHDLIDGLPPQLHVIAVAVVAWIFAHLSAAIGWTPSTTDIGGLTPADIQGIAGALLAYVMKQAEAAKNLPSGPLASGG